MTGPVGLEPPLFSIVTVCLNAADGLRPTLESLASQRFRDFELVLIDGGSTDATMQVVEGYRELLGSLVSEPDRGIYDAMNKGVRLARGTVVFFLNAGDTLADPDVLADFAGHFQAVPGLDLVYGDVILRRGEKRLLRSFSRVGPGNILYDMICHQAVFARRSLFERVGEFDTDFKVSADFDWLVRVFESGARERYVPRVAAEIQSGGLSTVATERIRQERRRIQLRYRNPIQIAFGKLAKRLRRGHKRPIPS